MKSCRLSKKTRYFRLNSVEKTAKFAKIEYRKMCMHPQAEAHQTGQPLSTLFKLFQDISSQM